MSHEVLGMKAGTLGFMRLGLSHTKKGCLWDAGMYGGHVEMMRGSLQGIIQVPFRSMAQVTI